MKKMTKKDAGEIYKIAKASLNRIEKIDYKIDDKVITVEVYPRLNVSDLRSIIYGILVAGFATGDYEELFKDAYLARYVIEYMTDIPLPTYKNEDGTSDVDLNICYEIVFGQNGLVTYSPGLKSEIDEINRYVSMHVMTITRSLSSTEALAQKILDLYEIIKLEIEDVKENPIRILDLFENLPNEDLTSITKALDKKGLMEVIK